METIFRLPWQVPYGEFSLKLDPLSIIFLFAIIILAGCSGIYGVGYMRREQEHKSLAAHTFFYLLLAVSFVMLVTANNVILFLGAWELMSICQFFLIVFHDEKSSVRKAGFLYLIATHCGTFCLFLMFFLMSAAAGSMDFEVIARTTFSPVAAGTIFVLALLGFGVKAGFLPLHIWLPHAHPAAPTHVSALLSGIAIKTGIYGICRVIWMIAGLPVWSGYVLLGIGIVSGLMGVLYALGQHELKKLLAYHSIENIGIIAVGLGLGVLGRVYQVPVIAVIGFAGALLHVVNHALFKGLLFLGAGAVIQRTHTGEIDLLGGLARTMPRTAFLFLIGALSICGLPLFNGFISEFFIYYGLFQGLLNFSVYGIVACAAGIMALALMGVLALACFTKVYGTVFLGRARSVVPALENSAGGELSPAMFFAMAVLAGLCVGIGLVPSGIASTVFSGGAYLTRAGSMIISREIALAPLEPIIKGGFGLLVLILVLAGLRRLILGPGAMPVGETWQCGFSQCLPRFQYTSSSFALPIIGFFKHIMLYHRHGGQVSGVVPAKAHVSSSVHDASEEKLFRPLLGTMINLAEKIDNSRIRHTQMYLLYIFVFLIFLLMWKMR
ncbi:MAG: proton-conducting transporter membrane subunit [Candidatus Omnitrophica bacterium]|nr:proton-conducting transporter membrane subunit [Candidatus Omnitrophota bacterium]